jgi:glycosyltransferase involved in cell wall biosynthesis
LLFRKRNVCFHRHCHSKNSTQSRGTYGRGLNRDLVTFIFARTMRIAVVNYTSKKIGGVESYLQSVLPFLRERGHLLSFWAETDIPHHRPLIALPQGTTLWSAAPDQLGVDAACEALKEWKPDVLYVHKVEDPATEERLLEIAPAVFFSHDYHATCISGTKTLSFPTPRPCHKKFGPGCLVCYFPRRCGGLSPITMMRLYNQKVRRLELMKRYRAVLVASEHMANEYLRHEIPAQSIVHTHKGLSPERAIVPRVMQSDVARLAFLGRLEKLKGVALLLRALPLIARGLNREVKLEIAGQGRDEARLKTIAARVMQDCPSVRINFRGWLSSVQCEELLADSHLMVMPSVWPEPFGGVGSLAGELHVPAVAFDVGGISQWLHDGVNGVLAPGDPPTVAGLAEAINRALGDERLYERLCKGAYASSDTMSMYHHVDQVEKILSQASEHSGRDGASLVPTS